VNAHNAERTEVFPQWLPFEKAAKSREISAFEKPAVTVDLRSAILSFGEVLADYREHPSPFLAAELMGVANLLGLKDAAIELATAVSEASVVGKVALESARAIMRPTARLPEVETRVRLQGAKRWLSDNPRDAIAWVERARFYTLIGQEKSAIRAIIVALGLAPSDRFVVRSAVRLFIHFDHWDEALVYSKRAYEITEDPLILGPFLSVAIRERAAPKRLKVLTERATQARNPFLYSETLEVLGTLDVSTGNTVHAKRLFRQAWKDPTKPVVSHSQWVLREKLPGIASAQEIDFTQSPEAMAWLRWASLEFDESIIEARAWALEEPYSREPYVHSSGTCCALGRFKEAEADARSGLVANHHDPILLNNLAFALLRLDRVQEAEKCLAPLIPAMENPAEVALLATYGLLLMKKGDSVKGADYYGRAIKNAERAGDRRMVLRASLNFAISTLETQAAVDPNFITALSSGISGLNDPHSVQLAGLLSASIDRFRGPRTPAIDAAAEVLRVAVAKEKDRFGSFKDFTTAARGVPKPPA
jgi:tetratricopeptide (TPR) repeat protein